MDVAVSVSTTRHCRDCGFHCYTPERLAEHQGHDLQASGLLYHVWMSTIDTRHPLGLWVHDGLSYLIRHDCSLDDGYLLGQLFNDPIYKPPQKDEILRWVDELALPL